MEHPPIVGEPALPEGGWHAPQGPSVRPAWRADLADFDTRRDEIVAQLMDAATSVGFFYVKHHGIDQALVDAAFRSAASFFDLPEPYKQSLPKVDWAAAKVIGYENNKLSDGTVHESYMQSYEVHPQMRKSWPDASKCPGYRETSLRFMESMHPVAMRILGCFATGLGLPANYFMQTTDVSSEDNRTFLQYHKYPKTEGLTWKQGTNRITAHTDESLLTLLWPSPGSVGLELAAGRDGQAVPGMNDGVHLVKSWMPCPQLDGCIVINIGDPLQMVSEGLLKSNYHRVRMPEKHEPQGDRYSMGYFIWPAMHDPIQGLSKKYAPTTMRAYMEKKGANFAQSFHPDPEKYEQAQAYAYGAPQQTAVEA